MDFDDSFYQQWKTQKINNRRLFTDKSNDDLSQFSRNNKIFSSTTVEDQTANETFSLRLSESYVDETQETLEKNEDKKKEEIIIISDSSFDEGSLTDGKSGTRYKSPRKECQNKICIIESSDDEFPNSQIPGNVQKSIPKISTSKKLTEQVSRKNVIIEESDSELEQDKLPEIIKETIAESVTLSDKKKKEILQWLSTNINGSRCNSSCSTESAIADSRKSGISSGNSSLERLEMNYETPNNRGKLSKPGTDRQKKLSKESENQTKIDQYFSNTKKGQLQIIRDITPTNKNCNKTPVRNIKITSKNLFLSETESVGDKTPKSKRSDSTPVNSIHRKKVILPEHTSIIKTPVIGKDLDKSGNKTKNKNLIISDSSESLKTDKSDASENSIKLNPRNIIIPESQSFESDNEVCMIENPDTNKNSDNLLKASDEDIFRSTSDSNSKNTELKNSDQNDTINDCADILENLYGATWRNKVNTLVAATEPRKRTTKPVFKQVQTDKKKSDKRRAFKESSGKEFSDKENDRVLNTGNYETSKVKKTSKYQDNFINDNESSESSPDCSYYTALTNPAPSQHNIPRTAPVRRIKEIEHKKILKGLCDTESDLDDENEKQGDFRQRKLSFDSSSSSSTSEFDPEDIVPPKTTKVKKPANFSSVKQKTTLHTEKPPVTKSFLASLSKDVPLEQADFKAMTFRVKYNSLKEELCKDLYNLFNEKVFDNKLPKDMSIEWSVRLRGTAGKCYNKQSVKALGKTVRSSRIVLATKILDSPDRLRDTLIHEMCHAATWLINNISDGHGSFWKAWASKAMKAFPELPTISRCHNYEIQTKYTYKCTSCGYSIGRHSKSLDLNRKRCGYCHGTFELLINKVTKTGTVQKKSNAQTKQPSGFALYVKENYHVVKQSGTSMKHAEVMKILGQQFSAVKITPKPADRIRNNEDESP